MRPTSVTVVGHIGPATPLEAGIHFRATIKGAVRVLFVAEDGRVIFDAVLDAAVAWPEDDYRWVQLYHDLTSCGASI